MLQLSFLLTQPITKFLFKPFIQTAEENAFSIFSIFTQPINALLLTVNVLRVALYQLSTELCPSVHNCCICCDVCIMLCSIYC